jgi:hypothetical protein
MNAIEPFALFDCNLVRYAAGRSCANLRELLDAIRTVPNMVVEHHMARCALDDHFELYEFPNDLARWCWQALGERVLAEKLGLLDPYQHASTAALRTRLVNIIEERLWGMEQMPACQPGQELHLTGSRIVAYDTGERIPTPIALAEAMPRLSLHSFYFHVHEAHRRSLERADDFSVWLEQAGVKGELIGRLRSIDFYFLNLNQLRAEFVQAFQQLMPEPEALASASA